MYTAFGLEVTYGQDFRFLIKLNDLFIKSKPVSAPGFMSIPINIDVAPDQNTLEVFVSSENSLTEIDLTVTLQRDIAIKKGRVIETEVEDLDAVSWPATSDKVSYQALTFYAPKSQPEPIWLKGNKIENLEGLQGVLTNFYQYIHERLKAGDTRSIIKTQSLMFADLVAAYPLSGSVEESESFAIEELSDLLLENGLEIPDLAFPLSFSLSGGGRVIECKDFNGEPPIQLHFKRRKPVKVKFRHSLFQGELKVVRQ